MATYVGSMTPIASTDPTSGNWSLPAGWADGDKALFWWYAPATGGTKTVTAGAGVTQKVNDTGGGGTLFVGWRDLTTGDTTFGWTASSLGSADTIWGCDVFRGLAAGDPFEAVPTVSHVGPENDPNPPAVTPLSDGALVWTIFGKNDNLDAWPPTPPTNYTFANGASTFLGFDASAATAYRFLTGGSGVSEDPGAWDVDVSFGSTNAMLSTSMAVLPALAANAGTDQSAIVLPPGTGTLAGSATGGTGGPYTYLWTVVSAPPAGTFTFTSNTNPLTTFSASHHGAYVLQLEADDGPTTDTDTVTITVIPPSTGTTIGINDVPLTRIIEDPGRRGIRIEMSLGSLWICDLETYDNDSTAGAYRPDLRDRLSLDYEGQRIFKGNVITRRDRPRARTNKGNRMAIRAKANMLITDRIELDGLEIAAGSTLKQALTAIHTHGTPSLADEGIALDPAMVNGPTLEAVTFDGVTIQSAYNRLMDRTGSIIRHTPEDVLEAFAPGDKVASYALTAANGFALEEVTWEETARKFVNRVTVKYGTGRRGNVDTFTGNGVLDTFTLTYPINGYYNYVSDGAVGYGVVDTSYGSGTESLGGPTSPMIWQYDPATLQIFRTTGAVANGATISVRYDTDYPLSVTVEDAASIAAIGLYKRTFELPDVYDVAEATEQADGILRVGTTTPKVIKVRTKQYPMPLPGDVVNLDYPDRLIANDDYLITRIDATDYVDQKFEFVLTCVEGTENQQSWIDTLRELIT